MVQTGKAKSPGLPVDIPRGSKTHRHRLYKLHLATMKKNVSWRYLTVDIRQVEHVHFYHSVSERGKANIHCTATGGHYHKIVVFWDRPKITKEIKDENGELYLYEGPAYECGPPLSEKTIQIPNSNQTIKRVGPVAWDAVNRDTGDISKVEDTHTHFVQYIHFDDISFDTKQRIYESDRVKIDPMINREKVATQGAALSNLKEGKFSNNQEGSDAS